MTDVTELEHRLVDERSQRKYRLQDAISVYASDQGELREQPVTFTAAEITTFPQGAITHPSTERYFNLDVNHPHGPLIALSERQALNLFRLLGMELGFGPIGDE